MRARRLTVLATSLTAATTLALAGCAGSSTSTGDAATPTAAVTTTEEATPPAASSPAADTSPTATKAPAAAAGDSRSADNFIKTISDSQTKAESYNFTMSIAAGGQAIKAKGAGLNKGGKQALAMTMDAGPMKIEERYVGGIWYMNLGQATGGKFVKIDPAHDTSAVAKQLAGMSDQMNPTASVQALKGAVTSVTKAGTPVKLDGVEAQPYKVVVDTSKITGSMGASIKAAGSAVPQELSYTYWVGADNLVRKMKFDLAGSSTEMTMSNWNGKVDVKAPSAGQISDKPLPGAK